MAWYPRAIRKEIPPGSNDPVIVPVGCVLHVAEFEGDSLHDLFGNMGGVESTWYVRYDGTVEQYRSTTREADANLRGNSWTSGGKRYGLHSIETEGFEHGEWTGAQIESMKQLLTWDAKTHGWPLQVCPDWNGPGVGYHVMFGAPGPWTSVAKTCPGPDRVEQFDRIIVPWLNAGGQEDDMPAPKDWDTEDHEAVRAAIFGENHYLRYAMISAEYNLGFHLRDTRAWAMKNGGRLAQILANQQAIMAAQGVEVDEAELAATLAPLLSAVVTGLSDEDIAAIAEAAADEQARRLSGDDDGA